MLSIASLRAAVGAEFKAVTAETEAEVHRFINWVEGKAQRIADAEALLKAEGFTVVEPAAVASPPAQLNTPAAS